MVVAFNRTQREEAFFKNKWMCASLLRRVCFCFGRGAAAHVTEVLEETLLASSQAALFDWERDERTVERFIKSIGTHLR